MTAWLAANWPWLAGIAWLAVVVAVLRAVHVAKPPDEDEHSQGYGT